MNKILFLIFISFPFFGFSQTYKKIISGFCAIDTCGQGGLSETIWFELVKQKHSFNIQIYTIANNSMCNSAPYKDSTSNYTKTFNLINHKKRYKFKNNVFLFDEEKITSIYFKNSQVLLLKINNKFIDIPKDEE